MSLSSALTGSLVSRRRLLQAGVGLAVGGPISRRAARADAPGSPASPTTNHDDPDVHLLVDDAELLKVENLERAVNRPRKHPDPVLVADRPWEGERAQAWGSVIAEPDGRLRMWYFAFNTERNSQELDRGGYCYAESRDGIHWEKPPLGLVEYRGSKENNLFYSCAPDSKNLVEEELARRGVGLPALDDQGNVLGVLNNLDGLTVVRDDDDPDAERRYKLIANMQDHRMWAPYYPKSYPNVSAEQVAQARQVFGQYLDVSPDGLRWSRRPQRMLPAVGDYMMVTRDDRNRRWWLNERAHGKKGRNAALRSSSDWKNWTEPEIVFDSGPDSDNGRRYEWHGGVTPFNYGNLNLGMLEKWANLGFGSTCELVCQREGGPWQRVAPGVPFLDIGPEGAFDRLLAYPSHNGPIRMGDTLYIFYTGGGPKANPKKGIPMAMGLATLGADRFAGLASWRGGEAGRIITRPLVTRRPQLEINVESFELQPFRVAVADADGNVLPGYGFEDSQVDYRADRVYTPVRWQSHADLRAMAGRPFSLHFELRGAAMYSFRFRGEAAG